jgi:hypothetical protein
MSRWPGTLPFVGAALLSAQPKPRGMATVARDDFIGAVAEALRRRRGSFAVPHLPGAMRTFRPCSRSPRIAPQEGGVQRIRAAVREAAMCRPGAVVVLAVFLFAPFPVRAAEKTLEFQLITKIVESKKVDVPNVEGQSLTQSTAFGVAVFKDGRIALKDFVATSDRTKDSVSQSGYSTYTFDDGSTLTLRWTAGSGASQPYRGDYKVISGTGVYAGATGSGTFEGVPSKFKDMRVLRVKLAVKTP